MSDTCVPGRPFWTQRTGALSHGLELKWVADGKVPGSWQTWVEGRQQEPPRTEAAPPLTGPCLVPLFSPLGASLQSPWAGWPSPRLHALVEGAAWSSQPLPASTATK